MAQSAQQPPRTYTEQVALLRDGKGTWRAIGFLALVYLVSTMLLGWIFLPIVFLLSLALILLSVVWTPAYHGVGWMMGLKGLPDHLARPPIWRTVFQHVFAGLTLAVAGVFIRMVFLSGFCSQNAICLWATHVAAR